MTEVKSVLLLPLFLSFSFSRVLNCFCYMLLKNLDRTMCVELVLMIYRCNL